MLAQVVAAPGSTIPTLGASGAIAAVMGAFLVTYPRDRIRSLFFFFLFIRITFIPAILLIGFWFLIQLFNVGSVAAVQHGGVAYVAHVSGFLFGVLTVRLFRRARPTFAPPPSWPRVLAINCDPLVCQRHAIGSHLACRGVHALTVRLAELYALISPKAAIAPAHRPSHRNQGLARLFGNSGFQAQHAPRPESCGILAHALR